MLTRIELESIFIGRLDKKRFTSIDKINDISQVGKARTPADYQN